MNGLRRAEDIRPNSFAAACYECNSIKELIDLLAQQVNQTDCDIWGLSHTVWRESIKFALEARISELQEKITNN